MHEKPIKPRRLGKQCHAYAFMGKTGEMNQRFSKQYLLRFEIQIRDEDRVHGTNPASILMLLGPQNLESAYR
jgi:hypothetical protein